MTSQPTKDHPIIATSSKVVYKNSWIKIREDKTLRIGNIEGIYGVIETNDSVVVCAINERQKIFLIYGYSYPTDSWSWQVPGGGGDNASSIIAAARELKEETGIDARQYVELGRLIVSNGLLNEHMAVVVATELTMGKRSEADDVDAIAQGKFFSLQEVELMIKTGKISDSQSISAIYMTEKWMGEKNTSETFSH